MINFSEDPQHKDVEKWRTWEGFRGHSSALKKLTKRSTCSMPILKYYSYHFRNLSYKRTARFDVVLHEQTVSSTFFLKDDERLLYRLLYIYMSSLPCSNHKEFLYNLNLLSCEVNQNQIVESFGCLNSYCIVNKPTILRYFFYQCN